jgi:thioredoxin reductase
MRTFDLLIVGSGPAGMSAAIRAAKFGLSVVVADEQSAPGGQIWRAIEANVAARSEKVFGAAYRAGEEVVRRFRASKALYEPNTRVWQIERASGNDGWDVFMSRGTTAERVNARRVLLATGAQERPQPFPGWTLPGVMTVGAAQILQKTSRQIPEHPVWVAGSGPLPLLYMTQLLEAGGSIAGWLDTTPPGAFSRSRSKLLAASAGWRDLLKGALWSANLRRRDFPIIRDVIAIEAKGIGQLEQISYQTSGGKAGTVSAELLLAHEGVIPSMHFTQAMGCHHRWNDQQLCFEPELDAWGETSVNGIFVAGDGAGIGGAKAAYTRGELAAVGVAASLNVVSSVVAQDDATPLRAKLARELATRPLLDAFFRPRREIFEPADETIVCRCEEVTAAEIRFAGRVGQPGPNQLKAFTRAGMGPCQGRQCGYTVANILAATQCRSISAVGFQRVRPPLKSVTLAEIASIDAPASNNG